MNSTAEQIQGHLTRALAHAQREWAYAYKGWAGARAAAEQVDEEVAEWYELLRQAQEREEAARASGWCAL